MASKNKTNHIIEMATTGPFSLKLFWGSGRSYRSEEFENPEPALERLYQLLELGLGISESDLERLYDFTINYLNTPEPERARISESHMSARFLLAQRHGSINCDFAAYDEYYSRDCQDSQIPGQSVLPGQSGVSRSLSYQQKLRLSPDYTK